MSFKKHCTQIKPVLNSCNVGCELEISCISYMSFIPVLCITKQRNDCTFQVFYIYIYTMCYIASQPMSFYRSRSVWFVDSPSPVMSQHGLWVGVYDLSESKWCYMIFDMLYDVIWGVIWYQSISQLILWSWIKGHFGKKFCCHQLCLCSYKMVIQVLCHVGDSKPFTWHTVYCCIPSSPGLLPCELSKVNT